MNDWVTHLNTHPNVQTPNFDRLAASGITFTHAYAASPLCNPSRASLISGLRPSTTSMYDNEQDWRRLIPANQSFLTHFKNNGYYVAGAGKFHHDGQDRPSEWHEYERRRNDQCPANTKGPGKLVYGKGNCDDGDMDDHRIADWIIDKINQQHDKPFLLTAGFRNPHTPWVVPEKYFDLYPLADVQLPNTLDGDLDDMPAIAQKIATFERYHKAVTDAGQWKEEVQAFLATISFVDFELGRILDALDNSSYKNSTVVVLWSDHGWHMGEKQHWRKRTLWEEGTRIPYIWRVPGINTAGSSSQRTVDLTGLYPSLCELAGIDIPEHVEGSSLVPLLSNPEAQWDKPAISTCGYQNHSVRTERWRYIRYSDGSEELYDHDADPDEFINLADDSQFEAVKNELAQHLPKINKERGTPARYPGCFGSFWRGVGSAP